MRISEFHTYLLKRNGAGGLRTPQKALNSQKGPCAPILEVNLPYAPKVSPILPKGASDTAFAPSPPYPLLCPYSPHISTYTNVLFQHLPKPSKFLVRLLFLHILEALNILRAKTVPLLSHPPDYHLNPEGIRHSSSLTVPFQIKSLLRLQHMHR